MFANAQQIQECEDLIKYILNATTSGWGGAVDNEARAQEAITRSRIYGTIEILRAISRNPQHGAFGQIAELVACNHDEFLPEHDGAPGIPLIVPFPNGKRATGIPADPDEIDSYRNDTLGLFSRALGFAVAHNAADPLGMPSQNAGLYSINGNFLKFTGHSCEVPLVNLSEDMCDTKLPVSMIPTVAKLAPLWNLKEGDNLTGIASILVGEGQKDLMEIEKGAMTVSPVPDLVKIQENS